MNNSDQCISSYTLSRQTLWAVEENSIYLINKVTGKNLTLTYPEAAFFDLISRNYQFDQAAAIIALIDTLPLTDARSLGIKLLKKWTELGFFEKQGNRL